MIDWCCAADFVPGRDWVQRYSWDSSG